MSDLLPNLKFYLSIDDVVEKEKRKNQCIVLADMCKDAFVTTDGGTMESDTTLRRNLLAMYERDTNYGLLEPFINELTENQTNYKKVLQHFDKEQFPISEGNGKTTVYHNVSKSIPGALVVCGPPAPAPKSIALIQETGLSVKKLVKPNTGKVINLTAAPLDPGTDTGYDAELEGIYTFESADLKQQGLPEGQYWRGQLVGGKFYYRLTINLGETEREVLEFDLDTYKGLSSASSERIKGLVIGNKEKNSFIISQPDPTAETKKLIYVKEGGDLWQILNFIDALEQNTIDEDYVVFVTTDYVVFFQLRKMLCENKRINPKYKVEVVYTGAMANKQSGHIHLTVFSNTKPTNLVRYQKTVGAHLDSLQRDINQQLFIMNSAYAENGFITYDDPSQRTGRAQGFSREIKPGNCLKVLQEIIVSLNDKQREIIEKINEIKEIKASDVPDGISEQDLLSQINNQIREFKGMFTIPTFMLVVKYDSKKRYNVVDPKLNQNLLAAKYGVQKVGQSGGSSKKKNKQKGGAGARPNFVTGYDVEKNDFYTEGYVEPTDDEVNYNFFTPERKGYVEAIKEIDVTGVDPKGLLDEEPAEQVIKSLYREIVDESKQNGYVISLPFCEKHIISKPLVVPLKYEIKDMITEKIYNLEIPEDDIKEVEAKSPIKPEDLLKRVPPAFDQDAFVHPAVGPPAPAAPAVFGAAGAASAAGATSAAPAVGFGADDPESHMTNIGPGGGDGGAAHMNTSIGAAAGVGDGGGAASGDEGDNERYMRYNEPGSSDGEGGIRTKRRKSEGVADTPAAFGTGAAALTAGVGDGGGGAAFGDEGADDSGGDMNYNDPSSGGEMSSSDPDQRQGLEFLLKTRTKQRRKKLRRGPTNSTPKVPIEKKKQASKAAGGQTSKPKRRGALSLSELRAAGIGVKSGGARKSVRRRKKKFGSRKKNNKMSGGKYKKSVLKSLKSRKKRNTRTRKLVRKYKKKVKSI